MNLPAPYYEGPWVPLYLAARRGQCHGGGEGMNGHYDVGATLGARVRSVTRARNGARTVRGCARGLRNTRTGEGAL